MSKPTPPSPLRQEDYLAIEAAVMETARGRWFLSEYARRNRNSDTDLLLGAIDKLEKSLVKERGPGMAVERLKMDLADIANSIEKTKEEIAQIKHEDDIGTERFVRASSELDAIVSQTESATGDILNSAEKIQEFAWTLREQGADEGHCDALDEQATNIYMACSFQDLTGQRIQKIVDAMRYVEKRVNAMIEIWGLDEDTINVETGELRKDDERPDAHLLNGPALDGEGVNQDDVDDLFNSAAPAGSDETAGQDDVDALFDIVESEVESEAPVAEVGGALDLDSIDFDAIDLDETDAVGADISDMADESADESASDVADSVAAEQEADVFAVAADEEPVLGEPPLDQGEAADIGLIDDMFETVSSGEQADTGLVERSANGIEVVESSELDWADAVSLEDLEGADVFAAPAATDALEDEAVSDASISDVSDMADGVEPQQEAGDAAADMLDDDLDMLEDDEAQRMADMHKVAAEMDRVASEMGLEGSRKAVKKDQDMQGDLAFDAEPGPLQKRVTDFG